ncbi:type II toxin-antitoxin system HicA family toxin [Candidatus Acetothermia bacterium]|nr:type II toxin-antitoxin system HicA family toxin [Candidatus Acetothermia bacterium]
MSPRIPSLTPRQVFKALTRKQAGYYVHHVSASGHRYLVHPDDPAIRVVIPFHTKDLPRGTLLNIIKQAKLTQEEFLELL